MIIIPFGANVCAQSAKGSPKPNFTCPISILHGLETPRRIALIVLAIGRLDIFVHAIFNGVQIRSLTVESDAILAMCLTVLFAAFEQLTSIHF